MAIRHMPLPTSTSLRRRLATADAEKAEEEDEGLESCDRRASSHVVTTARHDAVPQDGAPSPEGRTADSKDEKREGVGADIKKEKTDNEVARSGLDDEKLYRRREEGIDHLLACAEAERGSGGALVGRPLLRMVGIFPRSKAASLGKS